MVLELTQGWWCQPFMSALLYDSARAWQLAARLEHGIIGKFTCSAIHRSNEYVMAALMELQGNTMKVIKSVSKEWPFRRFCSFSMNRQIDQILAFPWSYTTLLTHQSYVKYVGYGGVHHPLPSLFLWFNNECLVTSPKVWALLHSRRRLSHQHCTPISPNIMTIDRLSG